MTIPHSIACVTYNKNDGSTLQYVQNEACYPEDHPHYESLEPTLSWCPPPLYRNTSLLSSPSSDFSSENENDHKIPAEFIPPRHDFTPPYPYGSTSNSPAPLKLFPRSLVQLRPEDIVCGRGAPTNFHPGNRAYQKLIKQHETAYVCSKRSEKPLIAMELMEILRSRGARFVKREKRNGYSIWIEIRDEAVYEKICQSLREGAPELRRRMLASDVRKSTGELQMMEFRDKENYSPIPFHFKEGIQMSGFNARS